MHISSSSPGKTSGLSRNPDYPMLAYPEYTVYAKFHDINHIKKMLSVTATMFHTGGKFSIGV